MHVLDRSPTGQRQNGALEIVTCDGHGAEAPVEHVIRNGNRWSRMTRRGSALSVVAIVTGGSSGTGREIARALTSWGWAIVVVYLEHQRTVEATVAEILAAEGKVVAVRADLTDDLDVQRLFAESTAAFAGVDVVVHTTTAAPRSSTSTRRGTSVRAARSSASPPLTA